MIRLARKDTFRKIKYKEQQKNKRLDSYPDEEPEEPVRYEDEE